MIITPEQQAILESRGNLSIAAVAGSGKTTTLIEYARSRPPGARILYVAFNKSVKLEAMQRFRAAGLHNVKVETAHSLAYSRIIPGSRYNLVQQEYRAAEIVSLLRINGAAGQGPHLPHVIAKHVLGLVALYCNSKTGDMAAVDYIATVAADAQELVKAYYPRILRGAQAFWEKMESAEIAVTHDFYLKLFQMRSPQLPYDHILFDEGQDASPVMADVFYRQERATRVIVGDPHQQIYGWRGAHNAMEASGFQSRALTQSFRFGEEIARLAANILDWKAHLAPHARVAIQGMAKEGSAPDKTPVAVLARTNMGLLLKAIDAVELQGVRRLYFEGNLQSYTYADEGASLYDVLALHLNNRGRIRDPFLQRMKDLVELGEYAKQTGDRQLVTMAEIVKKWGAELPRILKKLKDSHVPDSERHTAEYIFSTVHKAKGMEYDTVELAADFISERTVIRESSGGVPAAAEWQGEEDSRVAAGAVSAPAAPALPAAAIARLREEVNLLYVAVTRAKRRLRIPDFLRPKEFPDCDAITWTGKPIEAMPADRYAMREGRYLRNAPGDRVLRYLEKFEAEVEASYRRMDPLREVSRREDRPAARRSSETEEERKARLDQMKAEARKTHPNAYMPWDAAADADLLQRYRSGQPPKVIAAHMQRTIGAIQTRLRHLRP